MAEIMSAQDLPPSYATIEGGRPPPNVPALNFVAVLRDGVPIFETFVLDPYLSFPSYIRSLAGSSDDPSCKPNLSLQSNWISTDIFLGQSARTRHGGQKRAQVDLKGMDVDAKFHRSADDPPIFVRIKDTNTVTLALPPSFRGVINIVARNSIKYSDKLRSSLNLFYDSKKTSYGRSLTQRGFLGNLNDAQQCIDWSGDMVEVNATDVEIKYLDKSFRPLPAVGLYTITNCGTLHAWHVSNTSMMGCRLDKPGHFELRPIENGFDICYGTRYVTSDFTLANSKSTRCKLFSVPGQTDTYYISFDEFETIVGENLDFNDLRHYPIQRGDPRLQWWFKGVD